jgi:hypothetical protein
MLGQLTAYTTRCVLPTVRWKSYLRVKSISRNIRHKSTRCPVNPKEGTTQGEGVKSRFGGEEVRTGRRKLNNEELHNCTVACRHVARQRPVINNRAKVFSVRSVQRYFKQDKLGDAVS